MANNDLPIQPERIAPLDERLGDFDFSKLSPAKSEYKIWDIEPDVNDPKVQAAVRRLDDELRELGQAREKAIERGDNKSVREIEHLVNLTTQKRERTIQEGRLAAGNVVENLANDALNLVKGLWSLAKDVVVPAAVEIAGNLDWLFHKVDKESIWENITQNAETMLQGFGESVMQYRNPREKFHNHPLEFFLDLVAASQLSGGFLRGTGALARKAGIPLRVRGEGTIKKVLDIDADTQGHITAREMTRTTPDVREAYMRVTNAKTKAQRETAKRELENALGSQRARPASSLVDNDEAVVAARERMATAGTAKDRQEAATALEEALRASRRRVKEDLLKRGADFDLERLGEALQKFPITYMSEGISTLTRSAREASPTFNNFMAWTGFSKEARLVHRWNAERRREMIELKMQSYVRGIKKLGLTDEENKIALFQLSGMGLLMDADIQRNLKKLADEGNLTAQRLQELIPSIREEYDDIIQAMGRISQESKNKIRIATGIYRKDLRMQEDMLLEEGLLNVDQFRRRTLVHLANEFGLAEKNGRISTKIVTPKVLRATRDEFDQAVRAWSNLEDQIIRLHKNKKFTKAMSRIKIRRDAARGKLYAISLASEEVLEKIKKRETLLRGEVEAFIHSLPEEQMVLRFNAAAGRVPGGIRKTQSAQQIRDLRGEVRQRVTKRMVEDEIDRRLVDLHRQYDELGNKFVRESDNFNLALRDEASLLDSVAPKKNTLMRDIDVAMANSEALFQRLTTMVTRGELQDSLHELLGQLNISPAYFPFAEIQRKGNMGLLMERMLVNAGASPKAPPPIIGRLEAADIGRLRDLYDARIDGKPVFRTSLDELAYRNAVTSSQMVSNVRFLKKVANSPRARLLTTNFTLRQGESYFTPDPYIKYGQSLFEVSDIITKEMRKLGVDDWTAEGLMRVWPKIKDKVILKAAEDLRDLSKTMQIYAIPDDMAVAVKRSMSAPSIFMETTHDSLLNLWKQTVLLYNPGWYLQNLIGNIMLAGMAGLGLVEQSRSTIAWFRMRTDANLLPASLSVGITDDIADVGRALAARHRGSLGKAANAMAVYGGSDHLRRFATGVESMGRGSAFVSFARRRIKEMKKAGTSGEKAFNKMRALIDVKDFEDMRSIMELLKRDEFKDLRSILRTAKVDLKKAAPGKARAARLARRIVNKSVDEVNDFLFDYFNLHPAERMVMRRVFPFWTWVRNTNILIGKAFKGAFDEPLKFLAFQRMSKMSFDLINDQDFPTWLKGHILLGGFGDGSFLFGNLRRYNPFFGIGPQALAMSSMSPLIKVTYERISGQNSWTKRPFRNQDIAITYSGRQLRYDEKTGRFTDKAWLPPIFTHILNQFPQHHWLDNYFHPFLQDDSGNIFSPSPLRDVDGNVRYPREALYGLLQFSGLPLVSVDKKQIFDMRERKRNATKFFVEKLKNLRSTVPSDQWRIYDKAIQDMQNDMKKWVEFD